ncbi:MAG: Lrp/AsnC ligand binding domain-containing protein [Ilumatobacter sp.]|uniref:Lrp/AsnC ligand binding domain-containing protein n=1 Tax=Ilumatobacter sp. TaxID=1967498 RepID=UPI003C761F6D
MSVITAFVLINAEPRRVAALGPEISELKSVHEVHSVAGSGVALVATLRVQNHEDIATAVTEDISGIEGVLDTQTLIAFRSYSNEEQELW